MASKGTTSGQHGPHGLGALRHTVGVTAGGNGESRRKTLKRLRGSDRGLQGPREGGIESNRA